MTPPFRTAPHTAVLAVAYAVWVVPEAVDALRRDRPRGPDHDANSRYALYAAIGASVAVSVELGLGAPSWATFGPLGAPLFWVGVVATFGGVGLRWYSVAVLGDAFARSVTETDGQELVDAGPYAVVRHPTYTGGLLSVTGLALALGTWPGLLVTLVASLAGFGYRVRVEERVLRRELDGYEAYCERTPSRLVPGLL